MKLLFFNALWGMEGTLEEKLSRAAAAGYTGVEAPIPPGEEELLKKLLRAYNLKFIAQIFTAGAHIESFREQVEQAVGFQPIKIVSHSARDCMPEEEQDRFFDAALAIEQQHGIPVAHETHRHRAMYTPWTTARLLHRFPELKITADFSHWMTVCESHLEDQSSNLDLAINRSIHIHGRIGFPEGPQVSHPAAPEFSHELGLYTKWWQDILSRQAASGCTEATFTAEFGPPGYMPTLPFTKQPIADLWDVNQWMTDYAAANLKI